VIRYLKVALKGVNNSNNKEEEEAYIRI